MAKKRYVLVKDNLEIETSLLRERNELVAQGFREKNDEQPAKSAGNSSSKKSSK